MLTIRILCSLAFIMFAASAGEVDGRGLLVGAQIRITQDDYRTEATFRAAVERVMAEVARVHPDPAVPKMVVFTEYIGMPLVIAGARPVVFCMRRMDMASAAVAASLFIEDAAFRATYAQWLRRTGNPLRAAGNALLTHNGKRALQIHLRVFGELARKYSMYVCGGSLLCPRFEMVDGRPSFEHEIDVYNTVITLDRSGRMINVARKVYPTASEAGVVTPARVDELTAFDTELGRVGVLVCADGWFPDCYLRYAAQGVDILAQPSMGLALDEWNAPWGGYSGQPTPPDVDPADVGRITEAQAWDKYALVGRIGLSRARWGVNPFQVGRLFEHRPGGRSRVVAGSPGSGYRPTFASTIDRAELLYLPIPAR